MKKKERKKERNEEFSFVFCFFFKVKRQKKNKKTHSPKKVFVEHFVCVCMCEIRSVYIFLSHSYEEQLTKLFVNRRNICFRTDSDKPSCSFEQCNGWFRFDFESPETFAGNFWVVIWPPLVRWSL